MSLDMDQGRVGPQIGCLKMNAAILNLIDKAILLLFAVTLVAAPFLVINWFRYIRRIYQSKKHGGNEATFAWFPFKTVAAFVCPIMLGFLLSSVMTKSLLAQVGAYIAAVGEDVTVSIDGVQITDVAPVIGALKAVAPLMAHHSHPTKRIHVELNDRGKKLALELGRDSCRPTEYWVFCPAYRHTSMNEIGRITTPLFDAYK